MTRYKSALAIGVFLIFIILGGTLSLTGCGHTRPANLKTENNNLFYDSLTQGRFVEITGGCFQMGQSPGAEIELNNSLCKKDCKDYYSRELPRHRVCVNTFWLAEKEVCIALWRRFINATEYQTDAEKNTGRREGTWIDGDKTQKDFYWDNPGFSQSDDHPVTCVSFNDVKAFLNWLNPQSTRRFRLPTEAEWEYACRGGTKTSRYWGDDPDRACLYENVADQTRNAKNQFWVKPHECRDGHFHTAKVGSFQANPFGLFDMLGNVMEWCSDYYDKDYYSYSPTNNPQGVPYDTDSRPIRGGCWESTPYKVRTGCRIGFPLYFRFDGLGFRLAFPPDQK